MPKIDAARFLQDLNELRQIGQFKTGVHRPTYTPRGHGKPPLADGADRGDRARGRDRRHRQCLWPAQGAAARICSSAAISRAQNEAGWLDGALGVVAGGGAGAGRAAGGCRPPSPTRKAISRAASSAASRSSASCPRRRSTAAAAATTARRCATALAEAGLAGLPRISWSPAATRASSRCISSREPSWRMPGLRVGVVTGIVAIWQWRITIDGHAGPCRRHDMEERAMPA